MMLCISLTRMSFLFGDKTNIRNDKLDEGFLFSNLQIEQFSFSL
jgi:hypothetical protein